MNALPMKPLIITLLAAAIALLAHGAEPVKGVGAVISVFINRRYSRA